MSPTKTEGIMGAKTAWCLDLS